MSFRRKITVFCVGFVVVAISIFIFSVTWQLKKNTVRQADLLIDKLGEKTFTTVSTFHTISKAFLDNHISSLQHRASALNNGSPTAAALSMGQVEGVIESLLPYTQMGKTNFSIIWDVNGNLVASSLGDQGYRSGDTGLPMRLGEGVFIKVLDELAAIVQKEVSSEISPQVSVSLEKKTYSTGFYYLDPDQLVQIGFHEPEGSEKGALALVACGILRDDFFLPIGVSIIGQLLIDLDADLGGTTASGIASAFFRENIPVVFAGYGDASKAERAHGGPVFRSAQAISSRVGSQDAVEIVLHVGENKFISSCSQIVDINKNPAGILCTSTSEAEILQVQELVTLHTDTTRNKLQVWLFVTGGVLIVFVYFSATYLVKQFTRPIDQIVEVAANVGNGDLSGRVQASSGDEIGVLAKTFNLMLDNLEKAEGTRQTLEKQLVLSKKMEAIGTLASGVAHDLNNILSGVVTLPQFILQKLPEDSSIRPQLRTIENSGSKAAKIVEDMLTLSRSGMDVAKVIDPKRVVEEYLQSPECKQLSTSHPLVHIFVPKTTMVSNIRGSQVHLTKVLMNLINNSADAIEGYGQVKITLANMEATVPFGSDKHIPSGEYVCLSVTDTGSGISGEDLSHIFEPFFTKKTLGRNGTGLGMVIVWNTVKDHNGFIDVLSEKGKGTTINVYLPATDEQIIASKAPASGDKKFAGNNEKVVVVDDVDMQRDIAVMILNDLGYDAIALSSGVEAVEYVKNNPVDLVITDMIMDPGISGLETAQRILADRPDTKIILASGYSEAGMTNQAMEIGVKTFVQKPYAVTTLGKVVKNALEFG